MNDVRTVGTLRHLATRLLAASGLPDARAARTAEVLLLAESWGVGSHGLMRLPYYLSRLAAGGHDPAADLETAQDSGPVVSLRGHAGLGHWQAWTAAELATERARQYGVAAVTVSDSGHCGALGAYVLPGLQAGLVTIVVSNGPAAMAPWGSATAELSTSPIAAGVPCRPRPMIVDMALSNVARGRIAARARTGEQLPEGWALDAEGRPTTDAAVALRGLLAPLGGAKGFALALLVESLTGGVVGPALSRDVSDMFAADQVARPQRIAHTLITLDPARLDPDGGDGARSRLDALARNVTGAGARLPGASRRLPAEIPDDEPVALDPDLDRELAGWAARLLTVSTTTGGTAR